MHLKTTQKLTEVTSSGIATPAIVILVAHALEGS